MNEKDEMIKNQTATIVQLMKENEQLKKECECEHKDYEYLGNTIKSLSKTVGDLVEENRQLKNECKCQCQDKKHVTVSFIEGLTNMRDNIWRGMRNVEWDDHLYLHDCHGLVPCIRHEGLNVETNCDVDSNEILEGKWEEWKEPSDE
jgi:CRISPR/Cas system CMR subunit Cmr6 (Cas7 group RAMP superfamily)